MYTVHGDRRLYVVEVLSPKETADNDSPKQPITVGIPTLALGLYPKHARSLKINP